MEINLENYGSLAQSYIKQAIESRDSQLKSIEQHKEAGDVFFYEISKKKILRMFDSEVEAYIDVDRARKSADEQFKKDEKESAERHKKIMINGYNDKIAIFKKLADDIKVIERT